LRLFDLEVATELVSHDMVQIKCWVCHSNGTVVVT